ncbi:hypothetical protein VIGAN_04310100, partial [Vigna angularis var. angularis]
LSLNLGLIPVFVPLFKGNVYFRPTFFKKFNVVPHCEKSAKLILFGHGVKYLTILLPARTDVCNVAVDVAMAVI